MFDAGKYLLCIQFIPDVQKQVAVGPNDTGTKKRFPGFKLCVGQEHLAARPSCIEHLCGEPGNIEEGIKPAEKVNGFAHYNEVPWLFLSEVVVHDVSDTEFNLFEIRLSLPRPGDGFGRDIQSQHLTRQSGKTPRERSCTAADFEYSPVSGPIEHCQQRRIPFVLPI